MRHDATERLLQAHANCTWSVWSSHRSGCEKCSRLQFFNPPLQTCCLEGAAASKESRIASERLAEHYRMLRTA